MPIFKNDANTIKAAQSRADGGNIYSEINIEGAS